MRRPGKWEVQSQRQRRPLPRLMACSAGGRSSRWKRSRARAANARMILRAIAREAKPFCGAVDRQPYKAPATLRVVALEPAQNC